MLKKKISIMIGIAAVLSIIVIFTEFSEIKKEYDITNFQIWIVEYENPDEKFQVQVFNDEELGKYVSEVVEPEHYNKMFGSWKQFSEDYLTNNSYILYLSNVESFEEIQIKQIIEEILGVTSATILVDKEKEFSDAFPKPTYELDVLYMKDDVADQPDTENIEELFKFDAVRKAFEYADKDRERNYDYGLGGGTTTVSLTEGKQIHSKLYETFPEKSFESGSGWHNIIYDGKSYRISIEICILSPCMVNR